MPKTIRSYGKNSAPRKKMESENWDMISSKWDLG